MSKKLRGLVDITQARDASVSTVVEAPVLLRPEAVAAALGVNVKLLERWRACGSGPRSVRLSRKVIRYRTEDVAAFIASRAASTLAT